MSSHPRQLCSTSSPDSFSLTVRTSGLEAFLELLPDPGAQLKSFSLGVACHEHNASLTVRIHSDEQTFPETTIATGVAFD